MSNPEENDNPVEQERHLPHEAWHVVQQRKSRRRPQVESDDEAVVNEANEENEDSDKHLPHE